MHTVFMYAQTFECVSSLHFHECKVLAHIFVRAYEKASAKCNAGVRKLRCIAMHYVHACVHATYNQFQVEVGVGDCVAVLVDQERVHMGNARPGRFKSESVSQCTQRDAGGGFAHRVRVD